MERLTNLIGIGKVLESQLNEVGITSKKELEKVGAIEAGIKIKKNVPSSCSYKLRILEGAIQDKNISALDENTEKSLKEFYDKFNQENKKTQI
ncbi:MAG: TfoX/Sxy family protein [Methanobrevibacter sp.]|jgi:DNA transformation protein|nr:TfoX/Sxy family protein [Methanobrevibacter sp.]